LVAIGFGLGVIVDNAFHLEEPKQIMNAALTGKYDSKYQIKLIDNPIIYDRKTKYVDVKLKSFWG
jgi:hypothetical protein